MKNISALILLTAIIFSNAYASETLQGIEKDYDAFKIEMSAQLDHVESELNLLKVKAKAKTNQTQNQSIEELEKTKAKLKSELSRVRQISISNWKNFKTSFAASVNKLNSKVQSKLKD